MDSSTWLGAVGAVAGVAVMLKIAKQGELHINKLWIQPTVMLLVTLASGHLLGVGQLNLSLVACVTAIGIVMGWLKARFSIVHIDTANRAIKISGTLKIVLFAVEYILVGLFQLFFQRESALDGKLLGAMLIYVSLISISCEKLTYFVLYLRAHQRLAHNA